MPAVLTQRFELRGTIGTGGAGVVYRALDRVRGREVALKLLRQASGRDLYRFKREFRALADLIHPNLVALHELFAHAGEWYFTMELVEGASFIDWVRPGPAAVGGVRSRLEITDAPLDVDRLRPALIQLVDALVALHAAGKLHRDLKPSNVMVTPEGRVVLLDFGLVIDHAEKSAERLAVGTPVYMSPEQAADQSLTAASDWYSLGAMLYEALTGKRPFEGAAEQVMRRKQTEDPIPPSVAAPGAPSELEALCLALLRPAPMDRPDGAAILAALGAAPSASTLDVARVASRGPFVGRRRELDTLRRALADCRRRGVAVFVNGAAGLGKTALIRRFLDDAGDALVLEGRCYERESVPYKLLDTVVDSLATALVGLDPADVDAVVPRELASLARLFPVLRRVPRIAELVVDATTPPDPLELRQRAFGALRFVLSRLARRRTVIVSVDDVHWGDPDSAVFLADVVHHPEPAVLFVFAHALEDDAGVIDQVRRPPGGTRGADLRDVVLGPLGEGEARELVAELAGPGGAARADEVVPQAGGSPLFLTELARSSELASGATVETVVAARAARLPADAQALLIAISIASAPVPLAVAAAAAGIAGGHGEAALLSTERLARVRRIGGATFVEPAHDHVPRAITGALDAGARATWHAALATAYAGGDAGGGNPQTVVDHWLAAGEPGKAAAHAVPAAAHAEAALAFRRAAELYELALAHGASADADRCDLLRRRGHALACAGQLDAAAEAYGAAAAIAVGDDAVELARLQIEQLLRRGRLSDGLAVADRVLRAVGLELPLAAGTPTRRRVGLRVKSLDFPERTATPLELRRVDILYSLASGLQFVDPWLGRVVQDELLRAALAAGEPFRVCLALGQELAYLAGAGPRLARDVEDVSEKLRATAIRVGHPHVIGVADAATGMAAFLAGRFRDARRFLEPALVTLRDHGTDVRWEIDVAEVYLVSAQYYLGELREVARVVPILVRDALERGDRFAEVALHSWRPNVAWLIADRAALARTHLGVGGDDHPDDAGYVVQRYFRLLGDVQIDLYTGDGAAAWQRIDRGWVALERSRMLRRQVMRIEALFLRGRAALGGASGATGKDRADRIRLARSAGDELVREDLAWAVGQGELLRGLAAAAAGDTSLAVDELARAEDAMTRAEMTAFALAARLRRAQLEGGAHGMARAEAARDGLRDLGSADPDAFVRMLAPIAG